jgi:hypothetical protein
LNPDTDLDQVNPDPIRIQGFEDQKLKKKIQRKIFLNIYLLIKYCIDLSLDLHKGRPSYRRSLHSNGKELKIFRKVNLRREFVDGSKGVADNLHNRGSLGVQKASKYTNRS